MPIAPPYPISLTCPHCRQRYSHTIMSSGNTCGATFYSDGFFCNASMWHKEVQIIRCRRCKCFVWTRNMINRNTEIHMFHQVFIPQTKPLTLQETVDALVQGVAEDKNDEISLRMSLWWHFNNRIRKIQYWSKTEVTPEVKQLKLLRNEEEENIWNENLVALFDLLDVTDQDDRLMQAEILRGRGKFDQAIEILNEIAETELKTKDRLAQVKVYCEQGKIDQAMEVVNEIAGANYSQNYRLELAKRCCEQGEFKRAIEVLEGMATNTYIQTIAQAIRHRCQDGDTFVFVVGGDTPSIYNDIFMWGGCGIFLVVGMTTLFLIFNLLGWFFGR